MVVHHGKTRWKNTSEKYIRILWKKTFKQNAKQSHVFGTSFDPRAQRPFIHGLLGKTIMLAGIYKQQIQKLLF